MATRSSMTALSYEQRAALLASDAIDLIRDHERTEHGDERCLGETFNLLAYIAHALGVSVADASEEAVQTFICRLRDYSAVHSEHNL